MEVITLIHITALMTVTSPHSWRSSHRTDESWRSPHLISLMTVISQHSWVMTVTSPHSWRLHHLTHAGHLTALISHDGHHTALMSHDGHLTALMSHEGHLTLPMSHAGQSPHSWRSPHYTHDGQLIALMIVTSPHSWRSPNHAHEGHLTTLVTVTSPHSWRSPPEPAQRQGPCKSITHHLDKAQKGDSVCKASTHRSISIVNINIFWISNPIFKMNEAYSSKS